jgi:hypothetical protein
MPEPDPPNRTETPNIWNLSVVPDGSRWAVTTMVDGELRVVSRHPDRSSAEAAVDTMNASGQVRRSGDGTPT